MDNRNKLQVLDFGSGIFKNSTTYQYENRWTNCDKVRFFRGKPEKLGGWVKENQTQFKGVARDIISWQSLDSLNKYIGFATNKKVYLYNGGSYYDITPLQAPVNLTNVISTVSGSPTITITETGHNRQVGDFIILDSVASSVGGITFTGGVEYEVTTITTNTWTFTHSSNATSTASLGGGAMQYTPLLATGLEYNQASGGWGASTWSDSTWGTPRSTTLTVSMRQYSLDNWGEDLLINPKGDTIYQWDQTLGVTTRAAKITGAPTQSNMMKVIYPYRILASFGCTDLSGNFDPLLVRWSHPEDQTQWTPSATNEAGDMRLEKGSKIIGAELTRNGALVLTDSTAYLMQYQGYPDVFSFNIVGDKVGLVSQHGIISVGSVNYWMGDNAFYRYDGQVTKLDCTMQESIFSSLSTNALNFDQKEMVYTGVNKAYSEIIWLYPSQGSTTCNRYVIYNYLEDVWYDGSIDRSTWLVETVFQKPFATSSTGYLYQHEIGKNDDASPMYSFIESGYFDLGDGDYMMFCDKFIPDFSRLNRNVMLTLKAKKYPTSSEIQTKSYTLTSSTGQIPVRIRGRHLQVKFESNDTDGEFKIGKPRLSGVDDGMR